MTAILNAAQMRAADTAAIREGTPARTLIERAASAALELLFSDFDSIAPLFLCGNGNNGGDGLAMARFFAETVGSARVCYLGPTDVQGRPDTGKMSKETAEQFSLLPQTVRVDTALDLTGSSVVVDAIFGIGLSRPVEGRIAAAIDTVNRAGIPVLAIDIPSGVCADTGRIMGVAVRASRTLAMAAYKPGHWLWPGTVCCGKVQVADIGIPTQGAGARLLERADLDSLPPRPARAHKGTFGRVLVVGGSLGMSGAGFLSAKAAYRAGAGLVEILAPEQNRIIYQTQLPEALLTLYDPDNFSDEILLDAIARADAIAIGMGLGRSPLTAHLTALVLQHASVPVVIDADALNEIAATPALMRTLQAREAKSCITPHLGEMSRLCGRPVGEISASLLSTAAQMAELLGSSVVLKDARTVIADEGTLSLNRFGNNGMATGGSGDVLAGIIAAFYAAGDAHAAEHGVLAHALAGDAARAACGAHALMASDIIDGLCRLLS